MYFIFRVKSSTWWRSTDTVFGDRLTKSAVLIQRCQALWAMWCMCENLASRALAHEEEEFLKGIFPHGEDSGKNKMCEVIFDLGVE